MSALAAAARRASRTAAAATNARPSLRLVSPPSSTHGRTPFVAVVIALLSLGLTGLIVLSTMLQQQSFELQDLKQQSAALQTDHEVLADEVARDRSPSGLAEAALRLGMVPNSNPVFLRLSDGEVVGKPKAAEKGTNVKRVDR